MTTLEKKIQKKVDEINNLISLASNSESDNAYDGNLMVTDTSSTWEEPAIYKPIVFRNGVLYIEYFEPYSNRTKKDKILKRDLEFYGYGTLLDIAKIYKRALKKENIKYEAGGDFQSGVYAGGGGIKNNRVKVGVFGFDDLTTNVFEKEFNKKLKETGLTKLDLKPIKKDGKTLVEVYLISDKSDSDVKIKDWYMENYPTDDLGEELNDKVTFDDMWNENYKKYNIYQVMGVGDSVIRERLFEHLSEIKGVSYDVVYKKLFLTGDFADGGGIEDAIKGYKEYTKKNWEGYDYFSEKYAVNELAELELDLRKLNDGRLAPSKVVGGGYKNAKKVAQEWLQSQIDKQKLAIKTNGLSNYTNHRNFRSYLVNAKRENIISERKFNELLDESNEIMESLPKSFARGGKVLYKDLFEDYENQPAELSEIVESYIEKYETDDYDDYNDTKKFLQEVESIGYTFDYGLDNEPFALRKKDVKLNQVIGYEDMYIKNDNFADGGVTNNYVPRRNLNTITIKKGNQKLTYKISDVLNGAYKLESGASIEDIAFYVPKRSVVKVQLKSGKDFKPANGYWIKDGAKPIHVTKFDDGGVMSRLLTRKKDQPKVETINDDIDLKADSRIRVRPSSFVRKDKEGDWMMKKNSSKEARSYAGGGSLNNYELFLKLKNSLKPNQRGSNQSKLLGYTMYERNGAYQVTRTIDGNEINVSKTFENFFPYKSKSKYAGGGKVTFSEKAKAIAKNFEGKRVEPKYQKEYGKVYDSKEAKEVGNKIAGSQKAKYDAKAEKGAEVKKGKGNHKMKATTDLARKIRKDGEKWTDAIKRASLQLK
jgi:hypothetical protein